MTVPKTRKAAESSANGKPPRPPAYLLKSRGLTKKLRAWFEKHDPAALTEVKKSEAKLEALREKSRAAEAALNARVEAAIPAMRTAFRKILPEAREVIIHVFTKGAFSRSVGVFGTNSKPTPAA
jgi:hypothetical protein